MSTSGKPDPPSPDGTSRLSFKERELLVALRRLANARSQVGVIEEQLARRRRMEEVDPADLAVAEELQGEIDRLERKAQGRFGKGSARDRLHDVETEQSLVLERLGFGSYVEMCEWRDDPNHRRPAAEVDPVFVEFARRELDAAVEAYEETLALPDAEAVERHVDLT